MDKYNNDSIKSLGLLGGVRAKPASIGIESHNHTFIEILANSIDEANAGHGDTIIITKNKDKSVTVKDFGRGIPMGKNKDGEYTYKKIFDELFAGGKYDNNESDDGNYLYSLGTNGLGACSTNYTSDFFTAKSYKPEGIYYVEYKEGVEVEGSFKFDKQAISDDDIGTEITWRPSEECFRGNGEVDNEFIETTLGDQSIVNGGLKFIFNNVKDNYSKEYYYEEGIKGYIKSLTDEKNMLTDVISLSKEDKGKDNELDKDYKIKADIYFSFDREKSFYRYYHNSSWLENGGTPDDFIKNSFTFVIDKMLKENNLYNKNEKKILFEDVSDSLIIVSSTYSTISLFTDQTKKKIGSNFMKKSITDWLREQISVYFVENPSEAEVVMRQVLVNKRSREKSEKTRLDVKKKLGGTVNNLTNRIEGFINCRSKDKSETELFLVEGRSALGSTKQGRDPNKQAIYALRGKILNCLKADYERIFANDIIVDLIKILGCGVEVKTKNKDISNFNIDNLKWDKIIIATDGDVDGFHIRTLILTMIYRLMPTLIEENKVYIGETPLYEITNKGKTYFAYSDKEKNEIVSKLDGNVLLQRSKGLGENTAEMMWETTMNPETRKTFVVTKDDVKKTAETFDLLLGDNISDRKEYIANNLYKYVESALD
jgi:DNA gyrase subunit B